MIDKHYGGDEQAYLKAQREQAGRGGANANPNNPANFKNNSKLASKAGKKGGKVSRRGKPTVVGIEPDLNTIGGNQNGRNRANQKPAKT
jgi:general stress protein YciG